jgi:hypothetical protein
MDLEYWQTALREAEAELDAATKRSEVDAAAKKVARAKEQLRRLESEAAEKPKRKQTL